jgi:MraZ protein
MSKVGKQSVAESTCGGKGFLLGRYDHALDPKKRFTIPAGWRQILGDPQYVFVMPDNAKQCLNIIPQEEMEARLAKLREKALFDPSLSRALHIIGANSEQLALDVQGRIRISDKLLQFANLTTTVAMVGAVRKIELWNPEALPPEDKVDQAEFGEALLAAGF